MDPDFRSLYSIKARLRDGIDAVVEDGPGYLIGYCVRGVHSRKYILWVDGMCRAIGSEEWVRESLARLQGTDDEPGYGSGV